MSMSTNIIGFRTDQDKVLNACIEAGIKKLPDETAAYFGSEYPEEYLAEEVLKVEIPKEAWSEDMRSGYEIEVSKIPVGVEIIRFYNSW